MDDKQQLIEILTGIRSSRRTYYTQLVQVIEEMKTKNKQLEILSKLSKVHINNSWEDISIYIADQLSQVIEFDMFILTILDHTHRSQFVSQHIDRLWECKSFREKHFLNFDEKRLSEELSQTLLLKGTEFQITKDLKSQTNQLFGFLTLLNRRGISYTSTELAFFQRVADYVSVSIHNILLFKDLNKKISLEAQLIQSAKLAAIGEMAAGVAHELNSPLTVILGNVQLLKRRHQEEITNQMLSDIYQCGLRSKKIIENLLTFARQDECQYESLSLNELASSTLELVGYQLKTLEIHIETSFCNLLPYVKGSKYQIEQVLINLLLNARDALQDREQKKVVIQTGVMEIDHHDFVYVSVCDNGVGIKCEHLQDIFNPFFTTKSQSKGTGLGLSVSHGIAESHGGKLFVESEVNAYSIFTLALPSFDEDEGN
ncbi:ATP-binding protein [Fodinisporobacter ferrooxydans]|uniref:histidine kinase n=1 Tax=Fodinisporobacter ferrooxydans TaxID=2901836 RepID=A0ABY4CPR9_9BACL|nr:ATP-binding protein [Alicyclobacillaceae bacterium MYW30-H2]